MTSVVDVLGTQHGRVTELFGNVSDPQADRPAVLHALLRELAAHVAAERSVVYPVVKDREIGGADLVGALQEDYIRMEKLMQLIERRKFNSPDIPALVTDLKDALEAHVARSDESLAPALRESLSAEEQADLGEKVGHADSMVVTHPHPHLLALGPLAAKLTSFASRFDRLRDRTVTSQPAPQNRPDGDASMGGAT